MDSICRLRHTFAAELANSEVSVYTLIKLLGQEFMVTSQRYVTAAGNETRTTAAQTSCTTHWQTNRWSKRRDVGKRCVHDCPAIARWCRAVAPNDARLPISLPRLRSRSDTRQVVGSGEVRIGGAERGDGERHAEHPAATPATAAMIAAAAG
jgi:hypothetical protein